MFRVCWLLEVELYQLSPSSSQEIICTGPNMSALPHAPSSSSTTGQNQSDPPGSFTPTLATHFDENLIRHIQGWPSENTEKQVSFIRPRTHLRSGYRVFELRCASAV